jgi:hypothetical protein
VFILIDNHFYFISDSYFKDFPDKNLMQNKEVVNGRPHGRPCFFSFPDKKNPQILWCVPISSRVEKYQTIADNKIRRYHSCNTIRFGDVMGQKRAFLIQNMFPITERYIASPYIDPNTKNEVTIDPETAKDIMTNARDVLKLQNRGIPLIFPDVQKIEKVLIQQLDAKKNTPIVNSSSSQPKPEKERTPFNDLLVQLTKSEQTKEKVASKINKDNDPDR